MAWQDWKKMSDESLGAALQIMSDKPRSAANRFYFGSYQAVSALLLYSGEKPPDGREAWAHADTPGMIVNNLKGLIPKRGDREDMKDRLGLLYKARVSADYVTGDDLKTSINQIRKDATFLITVARGILPK